MSLFLSGVTTSPNPLHSGHFPTALWVEKEKLLDAMTPISGSGPAYFFHLMELMQKIAEDYGLKSDAAKLIVIQTCLGSARLALESNESLEQLRVNVTSPGGVTEQALAVFEKNQFEKIFREAIEAGRKKAEELDRLLS